MVHTDTFVSSYERILAAEKEQRENRMTQIQIHREVLEQRENQIKKVLEQGQQKLEQAKKFKREELDRAQNVS